jgi:glycosyltransferase involved in cell wall biosynthesis
MKTLDIVTSAKNESQNLVHLVKAIEKVMENEHYTWRVIISENASKDDTWEVVNSLAEKNPKVVGLRMSRDFGFEGAITAGLSHADADAVIIMASDLQDPPEYISIFLRMFEQGYDHVYQVVESRPGVSKIRNLNSTLFYLLAEKLSKGLIQRNSSTFRLISREVRNNLIQLEERNRFIRALVSWLGYNSIGISLPRATRVLGKSKANSRHVFSYAMKGILANSYSLLDFVGVFGLITSTISFIATFIFSFVWIFHGVPFAGFGMLVGTIFLGFGLVFLCLGIIAQYLSLVYEEIKARPNFVIREIVGG